MVKPVVLAVLVSMLALTACAAPPATPTNGATATVPLPSPAATVALTTAPAATAAPAVATAPAAAATAAPAATTTATGFPLTVTDSAGRTITLAAPPARIVSVAPSNTEILYALGLGDKVVAVDQYSTYPPEATAKATLGSYIKPDIELLVAARPDLVLATATHAASLAPALQERGITTAIIDARDLPGVFNNIQLVGRLTGRQDEAGALVSRLKQRTDAVAARVANLPRPRTYIELSPQLHSAGQGTFLNDLLVRAGADNVAASAGTEWPQLSQEALLQADPQVILLSYGPGVETPETVRARPGWGTLSAVKDGRVVLVDPDLTSRPGPRVVDGLEALVNAIHPTSTGGTRP